MNRLAGRSVHIYNSSSPFTAIGGLIFNNSVTNVNLYSMVEILCIFETDFCLRGEDRVAIQKDQDAIQPGSYFTLYLMVSFLGLLVKALLNIYRYYYSE